MSYEQDQQRFTETGNFEFWQLLDPAVTLACDQGH